MALQSKAENFLGGGPGTRAHLGGLCEVVVGHLREEVVHDVGADVVVDLVEDAVVPVNGRQPPAEVAPLLHAIELASDTKTAPHSLRWGSLERQTASTRDHVVF